MDALSEVLGRAGAWAGQNKYLSAIKNGFQNFMPATISGAVGVLWTNVLVNSSTGLGAFFKPIMALQVVNPIFAAMQYATISCITIGVTMLVANEIAAANGETGAYPALVGFLLWLMVTPTSFDAVTTLGMADYVDSAKMAADGASFSYSGIMSSYTGATGLFTGLIIALVGMELYNVFRNMDALKIKMPDQVPPGVARAFEVLIPTAITMICVGAVGLVVQLVTGAELNALIYNSVQKPLQSIIGSNIVAVCVMYVIIMLFWCVGIHGNNMVSAVKEPIFRPLLYENVAAYAAGGRGSDIPNILNLTELQMMGEFGGSGVTIGLVIAIFIFGKREENRTIAGISLVAGLFNINETMTFGIPLVLNPILDVPFIIAPVITEIVGYILISIGICPKVVIEVPWTMPPVLFGFVATGGNIMGSLTQLVLIALTVVIYTPFLLVYEAQQNKESAEM